MLFEQYKHHGKTARGTMNGGPEKLMCVMSSNSILALGLGVKMLRKDPGLSMMNLSFG